MDQRQIFDDGNELFSLVTAIYNERIMASLIIDKDGLVRVEGIVTSIIKDAGSENATIIINEGIEIPLREIIAVNGLFRSDYIEC